MYIINILAYLTKITVGAQEHLTRQVAGELRA